MLAVLHREHVVHRPCRNALWHGGGGHACDGVLQHVLPDQKHIVFKQGALHLLPLACDAALHQRPQCADGPKQAAHDVVDAGAGAQRVSRAARHVGQTAHHLHHFIQGGAMLIGAGQKAFVADVDQPLVGGGKAGVVQTVFFHRAGLEVFRHHIGTARQLTRHRSPFRMVQIDGNAFFVAVEHREKTSASPQQVAGTVAVDGFDFDDFRAQVGQDHAARRPHDHVGELHHAQACQGQRALRRRIVGRRKGSGGVHVGMELGRHACAP